VRCADKVYTRNIQRCGAFAVVNGELDKQAVHVCGCYPGVRMFVCAPLRHCLRRRYFQWLLAQSPVQGRSGSNQKACSSRSSLGFQL
jgi:hypothetical protein